MIMIMIIFDYSIWTEWSTIDGKIARNLSTANECEAQGLFEHDFSLNCTTRVPITN